MILVLVPAYARESSHNLLVFSDDELMHIYNQSVPKRNSNTQLGLHLPYFKGKQGFTGPTAQLDCWTMFLNCYFHLEYTNQSLFQTGGTKKPY